MLKEYYDIRIRIKTGTKIDSYVQENRKKTTVLAKIITDALENYLDILEGSKSVSKDGQILYTPEQLDIKEVKQLMKDVQRVNKRIENYIIDKIIEVEKKGV